jgi:hypothetical protein
VWYSLAFEGILTLTLDQIKVLLRPMFIVLIGNGVKSYGVRSYLVSKFKN